MAAIMSFESFTIKPSLLLSGHEDGPRMKKLDFIYLEITNECNLSCPFCPAGGRKKGFLTVAQFALVLDKISGFADTLYFHVKGEPLLHPDLGTFLEMAGSAGFAVFLTTNGTLLRGSLASLKEKSALKRVNISLQSLEGFPSARQEAALVEILLGVRELHETQRTQGLRPQIQLRLWNPRDYPYEDWFFRALHEFFGTDRIAVEGCIGRQKGIILKESVSLVPADRFVWPDINGDQAHTDGFCRALRHQAAILLDGTVVPCCLDGEGAVPLGNIYLQSWEEILGSRRAQAVYDGFSRRKLVEPLCRTCGFARRFS